MSVPQTNQPAPIADPKKNPSYPQRVHLAEKPKWLGIFEQVDSQVKGYRSKLEALGNSTNRPVFEKIFAQMEGARDQVLAAVKRLPQETGHLYEEDHHRVDDAVEALERLVQKWEAAAR